MLKRSIIASMAFTILTSGAQAEVKRLWSTNEFGNPEGAYEEAKRGLLSVSNVDGKPVDKEGKG